MIIRSRDNPFAKRLIGLAHSSRERKKLQQSVLDGAHLVAAYIAANAVPQAIAIAESAMENADTKRIITALANRQYDMHYLADNLMAAASSLESPAAVIAIITTPPSIPVPADADAVLVLENVQDPGNVGSMLRTAAAAGIRNVVLGAGTAFAWSPKVLRAAQGAHFSLNIEEGADVVSFIRQYQGQSLALVPASSNAKNIYALVLRQPTAFLIGNEGAGLSDECISAATQRVTIPMPGNIESLNAAASAAIAMFEMVRQRTVASPKI